jgi:tricorn protease
MPSGYYRFPTICTDTIVFACEDDLWQVEAAGGVPRRLTSSLGESSRPSLSPDGRLLAYVGREEGQAEIYLMPAQGGPARRLTFLGGSQCLTAGWSPDGKIIFANNAAEPFPSLLHLYAIDPEPDEQGTAAPEQLNLGPARAISFGPDGAKVIGRNTGDPARWKRYRGGTVGQLWIDANGDGEFQRLLALDGNTTSPLWLGERIYFISDHEGIGNIYSCLPDGGDLSRHTDHHIFYARYAASDGRRIVYHAGADLYLFDPATATSTLIPIEFHSPQTQRNRKFVSASTYLQEWTLHPQGHSTAVISRGKLFTFANWEGAVRQHGESDGVRYRLPQWLNDGRRIIAVTDAGGEESFVILHENENRESEARYLEGLDTGRPLELAVNPEEDQIAFSNHRNELLCLDLESEQLRLVDRGLAEPINGFAWSPDGRWLAYSVSISLQVTVIKLWHAGSGEITQVTQPVLRDVSPAFDPEGRYLYFISYRHFDPVYDNLHFDLNFPLGMKPYLVTLQADLPSPFVPRPPQTRAQPMADEPKAVAAVTPPTGEETAPEAVAGLEAGSPADTEAEEDLGEMPLDLEGIQNRILAFPVDEGRYGRIQGLREGKVLISCYPVESALSQPAAPSTPPAKGTLLLYDLHERREEALMHHITDFALSGNAGFVIYRVRNDLRVLKAGAKPDKEAGRAPGPRSGWLDLNRVKLSIQPGLEWRQMFREAWRLQRDHFWTADMSQVDWLTVHDRYLALVDRVSSRAEFSDLMWEMQGELGTSHCYELGGDYRQEPGYPLGFLGAEVTYDATAGGWRINHIVHGDAWDPETDSPLNAPGLNIETGDVLLAVNGRRLDRNTPPAAYLVNLAGEEVHLTLATGRKSTAGAAGGAAEDSAIRTVTIATLKDEMPARYREWVEQNRRRVHVATNGRVGYVHIPDMGARGYAEFHRGFLGELDRQGLIVDVRFNAGGHVSALILEKLARRRIGYDYSRWSQVLSPYPPESLMGPMVALTNEHAGSDGDIFCHGFKLLGLGPLLGKRTWGGVVGIWPRQALVDGSVTTQPEFSYWFEDVGWGIENYGTEPDIEVDITPQDHARGLDTQLERAVAEVAALLEANPPSTPTFSERPNRALPQLPPR